MEGGGRSNKDKSCKRSLWTPPNSMNNLFSYWGLIDAKIGASDKEWWNTTKSIYLKQIWNYIGKQFGKLSTNYLYNIICILLRNVFDLQ